MANKEQSDLKTYKKCLADITIEGFRVSGRPMTLAEIRKAFEIGFDAGRQSVEIVKPRKKKRK